MSFPICTSFKPTLLEGQLCYKLDLKMEESSHSGQGQKNELMLLLDYNTQLSLQPKAGSSDNVGTGNIIYLDTVDTERYEAKIHINTLSQMMKFGGGSYKGSPFQLVTTSIWALPK